MQFIQPHSLQETLKVRVDAGLPILAGGTDLIAQWSSGVQRPKGVISIGGLSELAGIKVDGGVIEIGALATHTDIIKSEIIRARLPVLADACKTIGSVQIQNRGTIGGNVMNASPAGDTLPVLLAYDADVEIQSLRGVRCVPFSKFYTGYRRSVLESDEILTRFLVRSPQKASDAFWGDPGSLERAVFMKIGTRRAQAISKVCACFRYKEGGFIIAFGSVAPVPIRCYKTEEFLSGKKLTPALVDDAVQILGREVTPIDDIRSTAGYRRHICGVLFRRFANME